MFRGLPRTVAPKLYALPQQLVERGLFASLLRGAGRAEMRIFERDEEEPELVTVAVWQGNDPEGLSIELVKRVTSGTCVEGSRHEVLSILRDDRQLSMLGPVPRPVTPRAAFGHPLRLFAAAPAVEVLVVGL